MSKQYLYTYFAILQLLLIITSCNEDYDAYKPTIGDNSLIGSWYFEKIDGDNIEREEICFRPDGTYSFSTITMPYIQDEINISKETGTGIYNINGNQLRRSVTMPDGGGKWSSTTLYSCEGNKLTIMNPENLSRNIYYGIVDSITFGKGDSISFSANGHYGTPISYESSINLIASVDEKGMITAHKNGVTHIIGHYADFDVVMKVIIKDGENSTTDFFDDLGANKNDIIKKYGKNYQIQTIDYPLINNALIYNLGTEQIRQVAFMLNNKDK